MRLRSGPVLTDNCAAGLAHMQKVLHPNRLEARMCCLKEVVSPFTQWRFGMTECTYSQPHALVL